MTGGVVSYNSVPASEGHENQFFTIISLPMQNLLCGVIIKFENHEIVYIDFMYLQPFLRKTAESGGCASV